MLALFKEAQLYDASCFNLTHSPAEWNKNKDTPSVPVLKTFLKTICGDGNPSTECVCKDLFHLLTVIGDDYKSNVNVVNGFLNADGDEIEFMTPATIRQTATVTAEK